MRSRLRDLKKMVAPFGGEVLPSLSGKGHYIIAIGEKRVHVSNSPSDHRADKKLLAHLKKIAKEVPMETTWPEGTVRVYTSPAPGKKVVRFVKIANKWEYLPANEWHKIREGMASAGTKQTGDGVNEYFTSILEKHLKPKAEEPEKPNRAWPEEAKAKALLVRLETGVLNAKETTDLHERVKHTLEEIVQKFRRETAEQRAFDAQLEAEKRMAELTLEVEREE